MYTYSRAYFKTFNSTPMGRKNETQKHESVIRGCFEWRSYKLILLSIHSFNNKYGLLLQSE